MYRTGEFSYALDPHAEFLVSPATDLASLIHNSLRGASAFSDVTEVGSALEANTLVEISISNFMETFANRNTLLRSWL